MRLTSAIKNPEYVKSLYSKSPSTEEIVLHSVHFECKKSIITLVFDLPSLPNVKQDDWPSLAKVARMSLAFYGVKDFQLAFNKSDMAGDLMIRARKNKGRNIMRFVFESYPELTIWGVFDYARVLEIVGVS